MFVKLIIFVCAVAAAAARPNFSTVASYSSPAVVSAGAPTVRYTSPFGYSSVAAPTVVSPYSASVTPYSYGAPVTSYAAGTPLVYTGGNPLAYSPYGVSPYGYY
ncbi:uncharacterized protein LOC129725462 [Wyeomyia smithii]|uniref:uncharacterized protein LOC129725462 n=1 Tax=Wyeomyia smithii TaxID=174621 RepID=UPI002467C678|nr:uncharacterized protein LOC129725462 [Wyeomyia smithii]